MTAHEPAATAPTGTALSVAAVVCTLDRPDVLRGALEALAACRPAPAEILVVDGQEGESSRATAESFAGVRYLRAPRGLTRQRNAALAAVRADVVAFFDDDARVDPAVFAHLAAAYADDGVVGATGTVEEPSGHRVGGYGSWARALLPHKVPPGRFTRYGYPNRFRRLPGPADVEVMQGCFMTARTEAARSVGFDEGLPGYGLAEDEDFSYRLSRLGRIRYVPDAVVHHENAGFEGRDRRAFGRQVVANRWYLFRKNFPQTRLARLQFVVLVAVLVGHRLTNADWRGALGLVEGAWRVAAGGRRPGGREDGVVTDGPDVPVPVPVLFVSSHATGGGSEAYLTRLLAGLGPAWVHSVVVLDTGPLVGALRGAGHDPVVLVTGAAPGSIVASALRLRRLLRAAPPRVVHANGVKAALVSVLATARMHLPVVWMKHDASFDGPLGRLVARRCAAVVGVSDRVLAAVRSGARRSVTVPPGVPVPVVDRDAARAEVDRLAGGRPVAVLVGRFHPVKGHRDLVAAARAVPGLRLLFVGADDPSTASYAADLRAEASDAAVFVGPREDVFQVLAGADAAVVPSADEGFGLAAAEALAVGTPVIAYAAGALPEVLGDCGRLVPPGDVDALAAAIRRVVADPAERERAAACGPARVADRFGVERWLGDMRAEYTHAVLTARAPRGEAARPRG